MTDIYILVGKDKNYDLGYLAAVLNSALLNAYHRTFCKVKRAGYLEFSGAVISELPIRRIEFTTSTEERRCLFIHLCTQYNEALKRVGSKQRGALPDVFSEIRASVGEHGTDFRIRTDIVHDFLAYLARQMIGFNEQKRTATKGFLTLLEKELKIIPDKKGNIGIEALSGVTNLKNYPGDYETGEEHAAFGVLWEVLRKNSNRLGRSLDARFQENIGQEYEHTLGVLLPIKQKLAATDWLIDQMVYRVYGLTEEEIGIVEAGR